MQAAAAASLHGAHIGAATAGETCSPDDGISDLLPRAFLRGFPSS
jgi:hypothetical protein